MPGRPASQKSPSSSGTQQDKVPPSGHRPFHADVANPHSLSDMVWDWVSCAALKHSDVPGAENGGQRTLMVQSFCPRVATTRHVLHALIAEFAAVMALALLVCGWILVASDGGAEGKCHRTRVAAWGIAVATEHHSRTWAGSVPGWDQSAFAAKA